MRPPGSRSMKQDWNKPDLNPVWWNGALGRWTGQQRGGARTGLRPKSSPGTGTETKRKAQKQQTGKHEMTDNYKKPKIQGKDRENITQQPANAPVKLRCNGAKFFTLSLPSQSPVQWGIDDSPAKLCGAALPDQTKYIHQINIKANNLHDSGVQALYVIFKKKPISIYSESSYLKGMF